MSFRNRNLRLVTEGPRKHPNCLGVNRPGFAWQWIGVSSGLLSLLMAGCQTPWPTAPTALANAAPKNTWETRFQSPDGPKISPVTLPQEPAGAGAASEQIVKEVRVTGNQRLAEHQVLRNVRTRPGRYFDPDILKQDIDDLWRREEIKRINGPYLEQTPEGYIITIDVEEKPVVDSIQFVGNRGISDRQLQRKLNLKNGQPLDAYEIRMLKTRIEELYREKGYPNTQVEIVDDGTDISEKVTFLIYEDQQQRFWSTQFEGNTIATDARLKSFVKSKPGIAKMFGGLVKRDEIDEDIKRLQTYYHGLGFFNCRIGREVSESNDGRWLTVKFMIDEGPRYQIRNVSFLGNEQFTTEELATLVKLKPAAGESPFFDSAKMNSDVVTLRDLYGSLGYVFANIEAEPRFLDKPGQIDLVYKIGEGKQYRVGNINVHIDGDYGVTRREVILNRVGLRPGDIIDIREIRDAERRLSASQIFAGADPSMPGRPPSIVVKPPELKELERMANREGGLFQ